MKKSLFFFGGFPCFFQKSKERKIRVWPFFIAKRIATATVSLPQRNRNLFPRKNRCVQFDCVNESQTSTANHRQETGALRCSDEKEHLAPHRPEPEPEEEMEEEEYNTEKLLYRIKTLEAERSFWRRRRYLLHHTPV